MNQLETIFSELGISHYLGAFVDQGFDTWETILDITESDLWVAPQAGLVVSREEAELTCSRDALGVKLGHRRVCRFPLSPRAARLVLICCQKLQRRIANYRGLQVPIATLVSPTRTSIEDAPVNGNKTAQSEPKDGTSSTKRKYRRHPKVRLNLPGATPPGRCCPRETSTVLPGAALNANTPLPA